MRAETRIALGLVVCLLFCLGFVFHNKLKGKQNEQEEFSLSEFVEADRSTSGESAERTHSDPQDDQGTAPSGETSTTARADEPPRDLFSMSPLEPRSGAERTNIREPADASADVPTNPWARSTGDTSSRTRSSDPAARATDEPADHRLAGRVPQSREATSTAVPPNPFAAFTSTAGSGTATPSASGGVSEESAGVTRAFRPDDLLASSSSETALPSREDSGFTTVIATVSAELTDEAAATPVAQPVFPAPESNPSQTPAPANPWGPDSRGAFESVTTAQAPSTTSPPTLQQTTPVFFQSPATSEAPAFPGSSSPPPAAVATDGNPFDNPVPAAPVNVTSDPFAPVSTAPASSGTPVPPAQGRSPFDFTSPPASGAPGNPASAAPASPGNPFGTTASSGGQPYHPAGGGTMNDPGTKVYEVQPGDNYWIISRKVYGAGRYFSALAEYNRHRIQNPDRLAPGMIVLVPTVEVLTQRYSSIISGPAPPPESLAPAGFFVDESGQPMYRVGEADTLSGIAQNHLGRSSRWVQIYGMNRDVMQNADDLKPGQVLRLPADAARIAVAPGEPIIR